MDNDYLGNPYVKKSIYESIDPILKQWAKDQDLKLFTMAKDWEIRSVHLGDIRIQVVEPDANGKSEVLLKDLAKKTEQRFPATNETLRDVLDKVYELVRT
jgi:hypothetical protein